MGLLIVQSNFQDLDPLLSLRSLDHHQLPPWARATMKEASPRSKLKCTKNVSNLWMLTRLVNSWMNLNCTPCWAKLVAHAHSTPWSKCSKRRWLVDPTTPMTLLFVHSKPTRLRAKLKLKCSDTH